MENDTKVLTTEVRTFEVDNSTNERRFVSGYDVVIDMIGITQEQARQMTDEIIAKRITNQ